MSKFQLWVDITAFSMMLATLAGRVRYLLPHYLFCKMVYVRLDSILKPTSRRRLVSYYQGPQKSWVKYMFNFASSLMRSHVTYGPIYGNTNPDCSSSPSWWT